MNIFLLTHPRELGKKTNTGFLVASVLEEGCTIIVWDRVSPDLQLLHRIETESVALLYPSEDGEVLSDSIDFDSCIIIDSTWQEAQKIYNKSPYLKTLKKVKIDNGTTSIYTLRRNQREAGLCTAECAIEVLKLGGHLPQASEIEKKLISFVNVNN